MLPEEAVDAALDVELADDELGGNPSRFHIGHRHPKTRIAAAVAPHCAGH